MLDVSVSVAVFTPVFAWVVAASSDPAPLRPVTVEFTEFSHVCTDEHTPFAHAVGDVVFDDAPELVVVVEELCAPATVAGPTATNAATVTTNAITPLRTGRTSALPSLLSARRRVSGSFVLLDVGRIGQHRLAGVSELSLVLDATPNRNANR